MTNSSNSPDLTAIAHEAEVEILTAQTVESAMTTGDMSVALSTAELGYYEAELRSLRDAATRLDEAEQLTS
jgi:phosphoheptose isomerase